MCACVAGCPPPPPCPPPPSAPPPATPPQQSCLCGATPPKYSTLGNANVCFGANDVTNLEVMFAAVPVTDDMRSFYIRCSDYDNNGQFAANDLTDMKRYYADLMPVAAHHLALYG